MGWLIGAAFALGWVWMKGHDPLAGYPAGFGPLDQLPAGLGTRSKPSDVEAPTTKIKYATWTWPPQGDQQFHVAARRDGHQGWVSYWVQRSTGARKFHGGWTPAQGDQVALLRKDFGV
jgi:hypothetical protein